MNLSRGSKAQCIDNLVAAGFALIPLMPESKAPYSNDWQDTPPDPCQSAEDFPDNYGVVLRDDLVILDIDPRQFKDGRDSLVQLIEDIGAPAQYFRDTFNVRTGGGGWHIYFKKPQGVTLRTKNKSYPGVEVKSYGSQVVGPGSVHPTTGELYTVTSGRPDELLPCPPKILDLWARKTTAQTGTGEYSDDEQTIARYRGFLEKSEGSVLRDGSNDFTYFIACRGRDYGLTEEMTFELMRDHWNPRCSPPWPDEKLAKMVRNAYRYAQNEVGAKHPAADFDPVEPASGEEAAAMDEEAKQILLIYNRDRTEAEKLARLRWDVSYDKHGNPDGLKNTITNVLNFFKHGDYGTYTNHLRELVRLNAFSQRIEFTRPAIWHKDSEPYWRDIDTVQLISFFSERRRWNPPKETVFDAVAKYADDHRYHPVRDYLNGLEWDGINRLDSLFPYYAGTVDSAYERAVGRCFLIACVARVMQPGCQHDHVPIMEGKQGTGKSSFCRVLGGEHYGALHLDPKNKDTLSNMAGMWIAELAEFTCAKKSEANELKAFISNGVDTFRKPYGRVAEPVKRQTVFIATINPDTDLGYLKDKTGNRRFWPLVTGAIRLADLKYDRDQLFAEAYEAYKRGEPWHLTDEKLIREAETQQNLRTESESWADAIAEWVETQASIGNVYPRLSRSFIASEILNIPARQQDRFAFIRIANAMKELHWDATRESGGKRARAYRNPKYFENLEEILGDV